MKQKTKIEIISTSVVMNGFATTAGSSLTFFARSGKHAPIIFAMQIVTNNAIETTAEI